MKIEEILNLKVRGYEFSCEFYDADIEGDVTSTVEGTFKVFFDSDDMPSIAMDEIYDSCDIDLPEAPLSTKDIYAIKNQIHNHVLLGEYDYKKDFIETHDEDEFIYGF